MMVFEYVLLGSTISSKLRLDVKDPFNKKKYILQKTYDLKKPIRKIGASSKRKIYAQNEFIARREISETKLNRHYQGFMILSGKGANHGN